MAPHILCFPYVRAYCSAYLPHPRECSCFIRLLACSAVGCRALHLPSCTGVGQVCDGYCRRRVEQHGGRKQRTRSRAGGKKSVATAAATEMDGGGDAAGAAEVEAALQQSSGDVGEPMEMRRSWMMQVSTLCNVCVGGLCE